MSESSLPTSTIVAATSEQASPTVSPFILAFDIVVAVFSFLFSFNWSGFFSRLFAIISFPFRLILIPLSFVLNILLVVFAPAIYLFSYTLAGVRSVWAFLASLEPLYTFVRPTLTWTHLNLTTSSLVLQLASASWLASAWPYSHPSSRPT
ncbi:hypothetical protein FOIG_02726 [Fusarium odoratissimum NRRL 54006]|uniref:Uncharacterized protein n=1 Tax=Fusarium odoratissimum (strain NRRL 54006) TaxID=1089451 RepID=X0KGH3_FUSO5|nr:uncharacterized protein FOIG_02726 [Fusarium odoratissimum NRRL 54006]EXM07797.1 hypothetical protein FOIG_02726 [Fusarium odoratissimum NRRL 54006]